MADAIRRYAAEYAELSRSIAEVDDAPSAVAQQMTHIKELKAQLKAHLEGLNQLSATAQKERKEWEVVRDSASARFKARMTGKGDKYDAKVKEEQQEYLQALEEVHKGVAQRDALNADIAAAEASLTMLQKALSKHGSLGIQIADLLEIVFGGPTPGIPEEDRLEQSFKRAQLTHDAVQTRFNTESQAASLLADANSILRQISQVLSKALDNSIILTISAESTQSTMLGTALALSTQFNTLVLLARKASDKVGPVPIMQVPIMSDALFDTSHLIYREKVMEAKENAGKVERRLTAELQAANKRVEWITPEMKAAAKTLQQARGDLFHARDALFKQLGPDAAPLPAYEPPPSPPLANLNPHADALAQHAAAAAPTL